MSLLKNAKVLVTGANGFTGKYVCDQLNACGANVLKVGFGSDLISDSVSCDIRNYQSVEEVVTKLNPDYVIHLAAIAFVAENDPKLFYEVNVIGTCNLLTALESTSVKKVLLVSSANVYGNPESELPITEDQPPFPINHYAASKLSMEYLARTWFEKLPIVITRPFNYTGPGQASHFIVPKIVSHFAEKERHIELGNLDVSRDFSYVSDIARSYLALLGSGVQSEVVNVCSGVPVSIKQVIDWLQEITSHQIEVRQNKNLIRENEIRCLTGDNERLGQIIGWKPNTQLRDVLTKMLEYEEIQGSQIE